jgi:hypothetical protein
MIAGADDAGWILADACRWLAFRVRSIDERGPRMEIDCEVVARGTLRDFLGFNRAKHAVIEGAILATRLHLLSAEEIAAEFRRLAPLVEKTAGEAERRAWGFLEQTIRSASIPAVSEES